MKKGFALFTALTCCLTTLSAQKNDNLDRDRIANPPTIVVIPEPIPRPQPKPPALPTLPPELTFTENGEKRAMVVRKVDTKVEVHGLLSKTEITMVFHNPHNRVLHGELLFPLPEGATVSSYGLDVGGKIVDASLVEKHKARIAFEKEVRKGVDPGLAEVVKGNQFRTRVYPIPARGERTVRICYVSPLFSEGNSDLYQLPLNFEHKIPEFNIELTVVNKTIQPKLKSKIANFSFKKWEDKWVAKQELKNQSLKEALTIEVPNRPDTLISLDKTGNGKTYFLVNNTQKEIKQTNKDGNRKRIGIFWDASMSRDKAQLKKELDLLEKLIATWKSIEIDLYVFRDRVEPVDTFKINNGDGKVFLKHLKTLDYDGGTNLQNISFPRDNYDYHILFSDGLGSLGEIPEKTSPVPVYTLSSSTLHHPTLLKSISNQSGGEYFNLNRTTVDRVSKRIGKQSFSLLSVKVLSGQVEDIFPKGQVPADQRVDISGKLLSDHAELELSYGAGKEVYKKERIKLDKKQSGNSGLISRFWAQQKINDLSIFEDKNKDEIIALGRQFELVTPGTSLIVLENLSQFIEHNIEPPKSRTEIHKQWMARRQKIDDNEKQRLDKKMAHVVRLWQQHVNWWERDFSKSVVRRHQPKPGKGLSRITGEAGQPQNSNAPRLLEERSRSLRRDSQAVAPTELAVDDSIQFSADADYIAEAEEALVASPSALGINSGLAAKAEGKKNRKGTRQSTAATFKLQAWNPKTPYIVILKKAAEKDRAYQTYIDQREGYKNSPSYYLDCAHFFYQQKQHAIARRVLTNLIEMGIDNPAMMRIVAYRLGEAKEYDLQIRILEEVLSLRPEEPQSYRDLALAYITRGEASKSITDVEEGMRLLAEVVKGSWARFQEIEVTVLMELNRTLAHAQRVWGNKVLKPDLDPKLFKNLDVDVRIVLGWDVDLTDIDLWVIEPSGEKAYYSHRLTQIGGRVSRDFTQGYGPEEYSLKYQRAGTYTIKANYYGSRQQNLTGPTTVKATVYTNFGRPEEKRQEITLRLNRVKDVYEVGKVDLKAKLN